MLGHFKMADEEKATQRRINLAALRKQDPCAGNILDTASSVAHYKFDATTERWEKTEFEGSLFVYNRTGKAVEVAFLIMNRLNKENILVVVKSGMEFKPQEPFLLCRTATDIVGIWFYDHKECSRISALLSRIAELAGDEQQLKKEIDEALSVIEKKEKPKIDVMKLFTKAKEDYDKKQNQNEKLTKSSSNPKFVPSEQRRPVILKRTNSFPEMINEGGAEEQEGISMKVDAKERDANALMKLLQIDKKQERKSRSRTLSYGEKTAADKRAKSEKSEKFSATMAGDLAIVEASNEAIFQPRKTSIDSIKSKAIDVSMLEATVLLNSPSKQEAVKKTELNSETTEAISKRADTKVDGISKQNIDKETSKVVNSPGTLLTPANVTPTKPSTTKTAKTGVGRGRGLASILNLSDLKINEKTTKSTATSSATSLPITQVSDSPKTTSRKDIGLAMKFPEPPSSGLMNSLMSPMHFKAGTKMAAIPQEVVSSTEIPVLNKQQFQEAIINLLQNDDTFVEKLHNSYLSMSSRAKR